MAVTIDVGEPGNIHPRDKQTVGHRLARLALADDFQPLSDMRASAAYRSAMLGNALRAWWAEQ